MSLLNPSLEAFWAVVQSGTVLKAAEKIELTQTGVTQRIRSLEKQLGVSLFTRSRKGMQLTQEGESLLHYVKSARDLENETLVGFGLKAQMAPPEISICVSPCLSETRVLNHLKTLLGRTPSLKLKIQQASAEESVNLLKSAAAQIALLYSAPKVREIESKKLSPAKLIMVGSVKIKNHSFKSILQKERFIFSEDLPVEVHTLIKKNQIDSSKALTVTNSKQALDLIAEGLGYGFCLEEQLNSHAHKRQLVRLESRVSLELPVSLLWYPRKAMPAYFKNTLQELSLRL